MSGMFRRPLSLWLIVLLLAPAGAAFANGGGPAQLRGVLLTEQGLPAVGYQVGLRRDNGDFFLSAPTTADGHFELTSLPPGSYQLVAFDPEGAEFPVLSEKIALSPGAVERMEVRISSKATPPGRSAPGAKATGRGSKLGLWWKGLPIAAKIGIVTVGAFAVYQAVDSSGDSSPQAPVSPSEP